LRRIDLQTGAIQIIGNANIPYRSQSGLTSTGKQLIGLSESGGRLFSIDVMTGQTIDISNTHSSLESLAFAGSTSGSDNDGMADGWEEANQLDPTNPADALGDNDADGLINLQEYLNQTDPNNADSDNDGLKDGEEFFMYRTQLNDSDTDSDNMPDGWEVDNGLNPLSNDRNNDFDGDGLSNLQEFQANTLANNTDSDNDGLSDQEEVSSYGSNPRSPDSDSDRMPDG
ncbi:MAG: hypothetical protein V7765_22090, partial [Oleispira sp.]